MTVQDFSGIVIEPTEKKQTPSSDFSGIKIKPGRQYEDKTNKAPSNDFSGIHIGLPETSEFSGIQIEEPSALTDLTPEMKAINQGFEPKKPTLGSKFATEALRIQDRMDTGETSILGGLNQGVGMLAGLTVEGIDDLIPEWVNNLMAAGAKQGNKIGERLNMFDALPAPIQRGLQEGSVTTDDLQRKLNEYIDNNPEAKRNIEAAGNTALLSSFVVPGGEAGAATAKETLTALKNNAGRIAVNLEKDALGTIKQGVDDFAQKLVEPIRTKKVKEEQVARTTETGKGIFKKSIIKPTKAEQAAGKEIAKIPGISPKKTFQQNYNVIVDAVKKEAEVLKKTLAENDFIFTRKEFSNVMKSIKESLGESILITGDAEKMAQRLIDKFEKIVAEGKASGSGLLTARKKFDRWVKSQKGVGAFDPKHENALSLATREIREAANNFLDRKSTVAPVKDSLKKQRNLYNGLETISKKAALEADTAFGRLLQKASEVLGTKNKIVQGTAAAVGIGGLGAAATFAPAVAVLTGLGLGAYEIKKLLTSPRLKLKLSELLKAVDKKLPGASGTTKAELQSVKKDITNLLDDEGKNIKKALVEEANDITLPTKSSVTDEELLVFAQDPMGNKVKKVLQSKKDNVKLDGTKTIKMNKTQAKSGYSRYKPQDNSTSAVFKEKKRLLSKEIEYQMNNGSDDAVDELLKIRDELDDAIVNTRTKESLGIKKGMPIKRKEPQTNILKILNENEKGIDRIVDLGLGDDISKLAQTEVEFNKIFNEVKDIIKSNGKKQSKNAKINKLAKKGLDEFIKENQKYIK